MKSELIGVWSASALFASGAQEDEVVVFRSDGTGWIEWKNFGAHTIQFFLWEPTSPGWYVLTYQGRWETDLHNIKKLIEREPARAWEHLDIRIEEVVAPQGGTIWQLEAEIDGWNAGLYGLVEADADAWPMPLNPV